MECLIFELNRRLDFIQKETTGIREDMILTFLNGLNDFKEKEKEQIINDYEQGHSDGDIEDYPHYKDSEQYFNQKFLSNESNT